jgi:glyoxylase-like metal-dependent hydrolase (beta-lactamase superfamily II)
MSAPTVLTIDCDYVQPRFAAAYLLIQDGRAAFVDNNTEHAVPKLLQALNSQELSPEAVDYVIITHVHLDHASGSAKLMEACPSARLLAHPRAAPHMIDPTKLVASARKVYGDEVFAQLYGELRPIEASRVRAMQDGETVLLGSSRELRFIHTRGHANHHFCIHDSGSNGIFTGDSFGLRYPDLQTGGLFIFPTTSPTDFNPEEALKSIDKILATGAERAYPTHFGELAGREKLTQAAEQLREDLRFSGDLLARAIASPLPDPTLDQFCLTELERHFAERLQAIRVHPTPAQRQLMKLDLDLNAAGIAYVARKRRSGAAPSVGQAP